jgi:hypothetical protein
MMCGNGYSVEIQSRSVAAAVRAEVDQWLIDRDFHSTLERATKLRARGFDVGEGAVRRYAKKLQRDRKEERLELARTRMAIELEAARKRRLTAS